MADQYGYQGTQQPGDQVGDYGAQSFLIRQILGQINTVTLVRILAVTNDGDLSPVGFVDVQPMVNQLDGAGNAVPHGPLHNLPYFRLQGGTDAIILDPKVGDIGMAGFANRDLSSVKANKAQANPGSGRAFDMADGLYFGGMLNGTPVQYVRFSAEGIEVTSPTKVTVNAPDIELNGAETISLNAPEITLNGNVEQGNGSYGGTSRWTGDMDTYGELRNNDISVGSTHAHGGVEAGGDISGGPIP